jgi:hypothetical protein
LNELGKQLSAFANGRGRIFYGLADDGTVDSGGVTRLIRGRQTAKDWLETIAPGVGNRKNQHNHKHSVWDTTPTEDCVGYF